jgi:phage shock protein PspC (stress-responsive transcriptional regulator)
MNKVYQVNLGGIPFTINDDAFNRLQDYLDSLRKMFGSEHADEIVHDIESRIGELFTDRLEKRLIVELADVEFIIGIIGKPEDLGEHESSSDPYTQKEQEPNERIEFKTGKRLYRNPDEKVIGGVASGIAAYLGIKDPIWIRLLFIITFPFSRGLSLFAYLVLMFTLKEAKTSKEKLEMRGDPINLANLSKMVESEVDGLSKKFQGFNKKNKTQSHFEGGNQQTEDSTGFNTSKIGHQIEAWLMSLGQSLEYGFKGLARVIAPIIKLTGGVIMMVLIVIWVAVLVSLIIGKPVIMMLMPSSGLVTTLGLFNIYVVLLLPFIGLLALIIKWFFRKSVPGGILGAVFGFWVVNIFSLAVVSTKAAQEFSTPFTTINNLLQNKGNAKIYHIKVSSNGKEFLYNMGNLSFDTKQLKLMDTQLVIEKSDDENCHLLQEIKSRGLDEEGAKKAAMSLVLNSKVENDTLTIPDHIYIPIGEKFRGQHVRYTLKIPENLPISFDKDLGNLSIRSRIPGPAIYNQMIRNKHIILLNDSLQVNPDKN